MQNAGNLEQLIERYGNTLLRTASAMLGDVQEAEDVVQETFIKYLEKQPVFESHEHAKAWLLRVTINSCKSRLRSPWRRLRAPLLESYPAPQPQQRRKLRESATRWQQLHSIIDKQTTSFGFRLRISLPRCAPGYARARSHASRDFSSRNWLT